MEGLIVNWSRAQFALTALYHFLFVPLTLGLSVIVAIMETIYVKTGSKEWEKITKFWMKLFGINFAIGLATGIILEFEFGTNWSNYSWLVGDIFGAPLAIEGILAFFMEATFFAVMFFGWNKVSKKFHLLSTWLVAIGSNLSALWILAANAWMQHPTGTTFNPDTARNEMTSFWNVVLSPVATSEFLHTTGAGFVIGALFVVGISAYYLLKKREVLFAKRSMIVGATFGLIVSIFVIITGDQSGHNVALHQPVKLAAMENLYQGEKGAGLVAFGIPNPNKTVKNSEKPYLFDIKIPYMLSILGYHSVNAYVPGLKDLVYGNGEHNIMSTEEKIMLGKKAIDALKEYKEAKKVNNIQEASEAKTVLDKNMKYLGYGYFNKPESIVPPVGTVFYAFHFMVALGTWFVVLFIILLYLVTRKDIVNYKLILKLAIISIPLGYIAGELGWVVTEVGRQPWAIQNLLPVKVAATQIAPGNIVISFWLFAILFTALLIAEIKIMLKQIKIGPSEIGLSKGGY